MKLESSRKTRALYKDRVWQTIIKFQLFRDLLSNYLEKSVNHLRFKLRPTGAFLLVPAEGIYKHRGCPPYLNLLPHCIVTPSHSYSSLDPLWPPSLTPPLDSLPLFLEPPYLLQHKHKHPLYLDPLPTLTLLSCNPSPSPPLPCSPTTPPPPPPWPPPTPQPSPTLSLPPHHLIQPYFPTTPPTPWSSSTSPTLNLLSHDPILTPFSIPLVPPTSSTLSHSSLTPLPSQTYSPTTPSHSLIHLHSHPIQWKLISLKKSTLWPGVTRCDQIEKRIYQLRLIFAQSTRVPNFIMIPCPVQKIE